MSREQSVFVISRFDNGEVLEVYLAMEETDRIGGDSLFSQAIEKYEKLDDKYVVTLIKVIQDKYV